MENQTAWKSDNQGDKEETFIQTRRRGGDGQPEERTQARWLADPARWWIVERRDQAAASRPRSPTSVHR